VEGVLAGCGYIKQLSGVLFLLFCLSSDTSTLLSHSVHLDRHCVACKYSINMAASENVSPPPSPLKIRVGILPRHRFCDLSGRVPFQISGNVARVTLSDSPIDYENHHTRVTVLRKGTVLDVPGALASGLLEIVEKDAYDRLGENAQPIPIPQYDEEVDKDANEIIVIGAGGSPRVSQNGHRSAS
jgi:hypothetical protein